MVDKQTDKFGGSTPTPPPEQYDGRESGVRRRTRKRHANGLVMDGWGLVIAGAVLLLVVVAATGLSVALYFTMMTDEQEVLPTAVLDLPTPVVAREDYSNVDLSLISGSRLQLDDGRDIVIEPWDGESRFTILLMGLDRRPGQTGLAYRTDTMMVVSLDPETEQIGILSIPRDLYVPIGGYSQLQRVNSAMVLGELQQEGSGPELAMQTVQNNLGIRVNDYLVVDFNGFIQFVDLIGGIEIETTYTLNDPTYPDMNYGYDPFYLPAGVHQLDGDMALKFARTRHGDSDFRRAQRQQEVLYAVRDRLLERGVLAQLIVQSPTLYEQYQDNVSTGLTIDQLIQLMLFVKDIPDGNINTGVLDQRYIANYSTPQGASVLIPNRNLVGELMAKVFGENYSQ